tara:strand:+ start:567 stop:833 length:267 start_codon:yes stop_codon:yes gene_type:complete
MNIPMTLSYLRPGEEWTLEGEEYAGLTWLSDTAKPTEAQLVAAWPEAQAAAEAAAAANAAATAAAIAHAKSLGFTDEMIRVMYPNLGV